MLVEHLVQIIAVANLLPVNSDDDVAQLDVSILSLHQTAQAGVSCGASRARIPNHHAVRNGQVGLWSERRNVAGLDAQIWSEHGAVSYQLWHDALRNVNRDGKADPGRSSRRRFDL
jgi:hypothetical protein